MAATTIALITTAVTAAKTATKALLFMPSQLSAPHCWGLHSFLLNTVGALTDFC